MAAGSTAIYPLTAEVVVKVAAALKAAHLRSATQYLGELRLGHIEAFHEVPSWLARLMFKCRLSLNRGIGPPDKAPEVRLEDIASDAEAMRGKEEFDT
eukprot:5929841-Heterocapsa_arctica.AAC.1